MKETKVYECEYCHETFEDEESCLKHENHCGYKNTLKIKEIICAFYPMTGEFIHKIKIQFRYHSEGTNKIWTSIQDDNDSKYIKEFDVLVDTGKTAYPIHEIAYRFYTINLDETYEKEIFDKMHEEIKNHVNKVVENCKFIDSKDFKNYKVQRLNINKELEISDISIEGN